MSVSIAEILRGAAAHSVPLTGECAGYLVLAAADQSLTAPRQVDANELHLLDDGSVRAAGTRACSELDAERDLRQLLDRLLSSASSVTPALLRAGRRAPGTGMAPLLREIERALIPVNRSAARRALARLEREAARAVESGRLAAPEAAAVAAAPVAVAAPADSSLDLSPVRAVLPAVGPAPTKRAAALASESVPAPAVRAAPVLLPSLTPPPVTVAGAAEASRSLEAETRPEPIVLRASARPPAPPAPAPAAAASLDASVSAPHPSTAVTPNAPSATTPVLGTLARERSDDAPTVRPAAGELDIEVVFEPDERTIFPDDAELIEVHAEEHDLTERCPPTLETMLPPATTFAEPALSDAERFTPVRAAPTYFAVVPTRAEELVVLDEEDIATPILTRVAPVAERPLTEDAAPSAPELDPEPLPAPPLEHTLPFTQESALPPWVVARPVEVVHSPPPRLAMPKPQPSDVDDLLGRLASAPLAADELHAGLKRLAGLDPTPPPPGTARD